MLDEDEREVDEKRDEVGGPSACRRIWRENLGYPTQGLGFFQSFLEFLFAV